MDKIKLPECGCKNVCHWPRQCLRRLKRGLFETLSPEQQKAALEYQGEETHGDDPTYQWS